MRFDVPAIVNESAFVIVELLGGRLTRITSATPESSRVNSHRHGLHPPQQAPSQELRAPSAEQYLGALKDARLSRIVRPDEQVNPR